MEPIVFLDFDGVVALDSELASPYGIRVPKFDPVLVGRLEKMCLRVGASVVVSSSWRNGWETDVWSAYLANAGLVQTNVIDSIPLFQVQRSDEWTRGHEIMAWVTRHWPMKVYCALDDWKMDVLEGRSVVVNPRVGLTDEDCEKAVRILKGG